MQGRHPEGSKAPAEHFSLMWSEAVAFVEHQDTGKTIEFETNHDDTDRGVVEAVVIQDDLVSLRVDGELVPFQQVREIGPGQGSDETLLDELQPPAGLSDPAVDDGQEVVPGA